MIFNWGCREKLNRMHYLFRIISISSLFFLPGCQNPNQGLMETQTIFVGTYTKKEGHVDGQAPGIYQMERNRVDGTLVLKDTIEDIINPSYLAISPKGRFLYATSETGPEVDPKTAFIKAYAIEKDGSAKFLNQQASMAFAPCYLSVHPNGGHLYAANYVGGVVVSYPIGADGSLLEPDGVLQFEGAGPNVDRQEASHPHSAVLGPEADFLYMPDLGSDKIWIAELQEGKPIQQSVRYAQAPAGSGPRHLIFHPTAAFAFVVTELSNELLIYRFDSNNGALTLSGTYRSLPEGFAGESLAGDIRISPDGRFIYVSNRGHGSIAIFEFLREEGQARLVGFEREQVEFPRHIAMSPEGDFLYVANQNNHLILGFKIDPNTGELQLENQTEAKNPVCIAFQR